MFLQGFFWDSWRILLRILILGLFLRAKSRHLCPVSTKQSIVLSCPPFSFLTPARGNLRLTVGRSLSATLHFDFGEDRLDIVFGVCSPLDIRSSFYIHPWMFRGKSLSVNIHVLLSCQDLHSGSSTWRLSCRCSSSEICSDITP